MTNSENRGVTLFGRRECYDCTSKVENEIRIAKPSYDNLKFEIGETLKDYKPSKDDWVFESLKAAGYTGIKRK
jgi:hypothetical protein